jgi:hypothetical protein
MAKDGTTRPPTECIAQSITVLRGQRVLLDSDLAALYEAEVRNLDVAICDIKLGRPIK